MKISVTKSGGFAGLTEEVAAVDTEKLDAGLKQRLEQTVQQINFFQLPSRLPGDPVGADFFTYCVTVSEGSRRHSVTFTSQEGMAAPLRDLIAAVTRSK